MNNYHETHDISKASKAFQLIFEDSFYKRITLWAKFTYNKDSDEIKEGDFILKNTQNKYNRYKIHKAMYCKTHKRIEIQLSHHKDFTLLGLISLEKQDLTGLEMANEQEVKMLIRVTDESLTHDINKECEDIIDCNKPNDKNGSILIGRRP